MKKWKQKIGVLLAAGMLILSTSNPAVAAEKIDPVFDLEQVVITATKTEKKLKEVPASVSVITAEDLEKANVKTLDDALLSVTGVYIKGQRGMKATKISIRGLSQNRVMVLLDGLPLNNGYTGGAQWANMPLNNIDRIEVVKGPFSALYGSSAMGGIVNIITKEGAQPQTVLKGGIGEQGTKTYSISHNGKEGQLEYYLDYGKRETDGYIINPNAPGEGKFGSDNEKYNLKMVYHLNETDKLTVMKGKADYKYYYEVKTDRGTRVTETTNINYQKKLSPDKELKLHWGELNFSDYWTILGTNYSPNPAKTQEGEVNLNWKINDKNLLTMGVSSKVDKCEGKTYRLTNPAIINTDNLREQSGGKTKTDSLYLQNELTLNEKATLFLGGRYDQWKFYDGYNVNGSLPDKSENSFSPKAALLYKTNDKMTWHASIGKAFSSPTIFNLARRWETATLILLPNSDLKPEKATSYELGVDIKCNENTLTKIAVFQNDVEDMIYQSFNRQLTPTKQELQWKNVGQARIKGAELEVSHRFNPSLNGFINYTYNDAKVTKNSDSSLVGKQVPTVPKETLNIGLTYNKDKITANLLGRYISRTYESDKNTEPNSGYGSFEPHVVLDTKISYRFNQDTELALAIDNLFNKEYYQESLAPGRTITLELTQKF